jgi:hypothetical protein
MLHSEAGGEDFSPWVNFARAAAIKLRDFAYQQSLLASPVAFTSLPRR